MTGKHSAQTVHIGDVELNLEQEDGKTTRSGRPNPSKVQWEKENRIIEHQIPSPADRTCRTSTKTLWHLNIDLLVLEPDKLDRLMEMTDEVGPFSIITYPKSLPMYIKKGVFVQNGGTDDSVVRVTMTLSETRD